MFKPGDPVCDFDKEPEPSTNMGKVAEVLPNGHVRVKWKDGSTSERPAERLGKFTVTSRYEMPAHVRNEIWDKFLQMSDEEIEAEIKRLERKLNLN
jgi:hypothetical protein